MYWKWSRYLFWEHICSHCMTWFMIQGSSSISLTCFILSPSIDQCWVPHSLRFDYWLMEISLHYRLIESYQCLWNDLLKVCLKNRKCHLESAPLCLLYWISSLLGILDKGNLCSELLECQIYSGSMIYLSFLKVW